MTAEGEEESKEAAAVAMDGTVTEGTVGMRVGLKVMAGEGAEGRLSPEDPPTPDTCVMDSSMRVGTAESSKTMGSATCCIDIDPRAVEPFAAATSGVRSSTLLRLPPLLLLLLLLLTPLLLLLCALSISGLLSLGARMGMPAPMVRSSARKL